MSDSVLYMLMELESFIASLNPAYLDVQTHPALCARGRCPPPPLPSLSRLPPAPPVPPLHSSIQATMTRTRFAIDCSNAHVGLNAGTALNAQTESSTKDDSDRVGDVSIAEIASIYELICGGKSGGTGD